MAVGLHAVNLADKWLNMLAGTAFSGAPANTYVALHTADPGAAGATAPSGNTTRVVLAWAAASAGSKAIQATLPQWASWASGAETISHISIWDASTAGNFLFSIALTASKAVSNGDTLNLTSMSVSFTPIAS